MGFLLKLFTCSRLPPKKIAVVVIGRLGLWFATFDSR